MTNNKTAEQDFADLKNRMNRVVLTYYVYKSLRRSINVPEVGPEVAKENAAIQNEHLTFWTVTEWALINYIVINLHKFFDKPRDALKLKTLLNSYKGDPSIKNLENLIDSQGEVIKRLEEIRNDIAAHEKKGNVTSKIVLPSLEDLEGLISTVQQVINDLSYKFNQSTTSWEGLQSQAETDTEFLIDTLRERNRQASSNKPNKS